MVVDLVGCCRRTGEQGRIDSARGRSIAVRLWRDVSYNVFPMRTPGTGTAPGAMLATRSIGR